MQKVVVQVYDLRVYLTENCIFGIALSRVRSYVVNIQARGRELVISRKMTPSEIDFPQDAVVVNFHYEIVKAISKMRSRRTIRGEFDIIREKLYSCKLSFNMAKEEPVSIDTFTTS